MFIFNEQVKNLNKIKETQTLAFRVARFSCHHLALHIHNFHRRRMAVGIAEAQHIHRADADADAAADARAGGVVQHLLLQRVAHYVDADLAMARAFVAAALCRRNCLRRLAKLF